VKKTKNKYLLQATLIGLLALPIVSGVAWAATGTDSSTSPLIPPADPEQSTTLQERMAQRKSALKIPLTTAQSQNIIKKCSTAQTVLQKVQATDKTKISNRTQIYTDLATHISTVITQLDSQHVDTTNLKLVQTKFNQSINQYLADSVTYKTTLDDIVAMNCKTDPTGFQTTLVNARQLRTKLSNEAAQIKSTVPTTTKAITDLKNNISKAGAAQ
jgi:hypothetical protein